MAVIDKYKPEQHHQHKQHSKLDVWINNNRNKSSDSRKNPVIPKKSHIKSYRFISFCKYESEPRRYINVQYIQQNYPRMIPRYGTPVDVTKVEIEIIEKIVVRSEENEVFIYEERKSKNYAKVTLQFSEKCSQGKYNWMNIFLNR